MTHALPALIVVGAGSAGMAASLFAAQGGARVVLLEAGDEIGGTTTISAGQLSAGGTRLQCARGIDDSPERHADDVMRLGHANGDPAMIRLATALAPGLIDWLQDTGFVFAPECPQRVHGFEGYDRPRTYWSPDGGRAITRHFAARLEATAGIELRLGTRLVDLLAGEDGAVLGVRALDAQGRIMEIRGGAVALTCGGYAGGPALFAELTGGRRLVSGALVHNTGAGLLAARRIGAHVAGGAHFLPRYGGIEDRPDSGRLMAGATPLLSVAARAPVEIHVNAEGRRFVAEDAPAPQARERALLDQPGMVFWIISDARMRREAPPLIAGWTDDDWQARLGAHRGFVRADDLATLARRMAVPGEALARTVAEFNRAVERGADAFGRRHMPLPLAEPPFHALRNHGSTLTSGAGLRVDAGLRVLRADGTAIRNLYAAGEILGRELLSGDAYVGGMTLTPALAFGRLIGERIAEAARNEVQAG